MRSTSADTNARLLSSSHATSSSSHSKFHGPTVQNLSASIPNGHGAGSVLASRVPTACLHDTSRQLRTPRFVRWATCDAHCKVPAAAPAPCDFKADVKSGCWFCSECAGCESFLCNNCGYLQRPSPELSFFTAFGLCASLYMWLTCRTSSADTPACTHA